MNDHHWKSPISERDKDALFPLRLKCRQCGFECCIHNREDADLLDALEIALRNKEPFEVRSFAWTQSFCSGYLVGSSSEPDDPSDPSRQHFPTVRDALRARIEGR